MTTQPQLLQIALDKKDVVYTPDWVARDMVEYFKPTGRILEPCSGDGAFLKYLPGADWCEIEKGRDFYAVTEQYDWIIGNPPYTQYSEWLNQSMAIAENILYLVPINKECNGFEMMSVVNEWGGVYARRIYGPGSRLQFPVGFACGALHYKRDYHGPMYTSFYEGAL
jgi:hypothetical protein